MSWQHIHAVRDLELPHVEKVILYTLASRVDDHGACWPSLNTLAKDAGLARRTLQYHLRTLVDTGLVSREERRGATTVMRLQLGEPDTRATGAGAHGTDADVRGMHGEVHAVFETHAPHASEVKELPLNPQELPRARELSTTRAGNSQKRQTLDHRSSCSWTLVGNAAAGRGVLRGGGKVQPDIDPTMERVGLATEGSTRQRRCVCPTALRRILSSPGWYPTIGRHAAFPSLSWRRASG